MSEFLGARISLISKSDIRYSGVLHDISSEDSTVSLENVISYGTEGRKGKPEEEIPPADQIYEYIVFRGSDVKDLRIEETPAPPPPFQPPVPNDPAILGARPRPGSNNAPPFQQGPPRGQPQGPMPSRPQQGGPGYAPNMPMPPNAGGWGPSGPSRNFPYPPPPGWYPPQGPGFGPGGPVGAQWNNNNFYPPGAQQQQQSPFAPGPSGRSPQPTQPADGRPSPVGAPGKQELPASGPAQSSAPAAAPASGPVPAPAPVPAATESEPKSMGQPSADIRPPPTGPSADTKATVPMAPAESAASALPSGPGATTRIAPIVPLPAALVNKSAAPAAAAKPTGDSTAQDATQAARAAVAAAMANLRQAGAVSGAAPTGPSAQQQGAPNSSQAMDNLTRKVNEMRVNATARPAGTNYPRNRGTRGGGPRTARVEVPDTEFDFASSNAKFNKEDVVKEAATGGAAPEVETGAAASGASVMSAVPATADASDAGEADAAAEQPAAYNKTRSFFDNISSDSKDRAASANGGTRAGGREWRGEEQRKNMETFGQGSVDGGNRNYRGRGRGRGRGYGRGRGGGYNRNNSYNNYNGSNQQTTPSQ